MVDSVVSSHFGKRPLLEIPALQVSNQASPEFPLPQAPVLPYVSNNSFPPVNNLMLGPGGQHSQPPFYPGSWQQSQMPFAGLAGRHHSAPPGSLFNLQGHQYPWGPSSEVAYPAPFYQSQRTHPGMANPFPGYVHAPRPMPARMPYPSYGLPSPGFNITCELEYGRIKNINVRDTGGEFRGIPGFLGKEFMRTYSAYPYTKVKVRLEDGEFHIYASHGHRRRHLRLTQRGRDSDIDSDRQMFDDDDSDEGFVSFPGRGSTADSDLRIRRYRSHRAEPRGIINERNRNDKE